MRGTFSPRATGMLVTALLVTLLSAPAASAHSVLLSSTPARDSSISAAPPQVTLEFNETLDGGFTELTVLGPDGRSHWEDSPPSIVDNKVTARLRTLGPAGGYTIHYRVVSADGHPVSGTIPFTLPAAGPGSPAASTQAMSSAPAGTVPIWPWIAGAAALVVAAVVVSRRLTRG